VLLKLSRLAIYIFVEVLGKISGELDRGGFRPWPLHVHPALYFPNDLVPTAAQKTNVPESTNSPMWMDRSVRLAKASDRDPSFALDRLR
jgi:hypothetical protein